MIEYKVSPYAYRFILSFMSECFIAGNLKEDVFDAALKDWEIFAVNLPQKNPKDWN